MTDYIPQPGDRVLVTIPPFQATALESRWFDIGDRGVSMTMLEALNATITRVVPPEPAVGSVWLDADGATIVRERFDIPSPSRWWVASTGPWLTWAQVQALGGSLLHDAGTVQP